MGLHCTWNGCTIATLCKEMPVDKKWYVFDEADCLAHCETPESAGEHANRYATMGGFEGVHIVHMTRAQFDHYCTHNNLAAALKVK